MSTVATTQKTFIDDPQKIDKYADIMVNFALNGGEGINSGETVWLCGNEAGKSLYLAIRNKIWEAGGNVIDRFILDEDSRYGLNRDRLEISNDEQLAFYPEKYFEGLIADVDHVLFVLSTVDPHALEGIDPAKIMTINRSIEPYMKLRTDKEDRGDLSWSLCLFPTEGMAEEAGISFEEYCQQVEDACFLNHPDPVQKWREVTAEMERIRDKLSGMCIEKVHIEGDDADLWVQLGADRKFMAGSGRNIPSFEIFASPDWRGTNGWIRFNQPLYYNDVRISGVYLEFKNGPVSKSSAEENEETLKAMIAEENADKVGEWSLTDARHSKITKFMAMTLYDENVGGSEGNTHIALGKAYRDGYKGDIANTSEEEWEAKGYNYSVVHTDIVSTTRRKVTAYFDDDREPMIIYENGQFTI